ncbi:MAG: GNA1162 family protein [Candidatus Scalinduaceae bacterium]
METKFFNCSPLYVCLKWSSLKLNLLLIIIALSSCNYLQESSKPKITTPFSPKHNHIRTIAILPFKNLTANNEITTILRRAIYGNLSLRDYGLIKLNQIDQRLKIASYHTADMDKTDAYKLGKILSADALIYGRVTKCSKLFGVVYSRVDIGAELVMVDTSNSKIIWKANHVELTHSGSPPISPFSIPEKIINSTINIRDKVNTVRHDNF